VVVVRVVAAGCTTALSWVVVVVVLVVAGSEAHEIRNMVAKTESSDVNMVSFFIWKCLL
jgi:hypothetical protein